MAKPILIPAIERDFENVCTTSRFSYLSISGRQLVPPKSIYASSITTTDVGFAFSISSIVSRLSSTPVGALGLGIIIPPLSHL